MFTLELGHTDRFHDLFIVSALIHDEIETPFIFKGELAALPGLDGWAGQERLEISRLSLAGYAQVRGDYGILNCGVVIGRDTGPYIIGRPGVSIENPDEVEFMVNGTSTTFYLPLCLYLGGYPKKIKPTSDPVHQALLAGQARLGIVEAMDLAPAQEAGLEVIVDLGEWWSGQVGKPLALEVFAVRRVLGQEAAREIDNGLRRSFLLAQSDREALSGLIQKTIPGYSDLPENLAQVPYLNQFSSDLGPEGQEALEALFSKAEELEVVPRSGLPLWAY